MRRKPDTPDTLTPARINRTPVHFCWPYTPTATATAHPSGVNVVLFESLVFVFCVVLLGVYCVNRRRSAHPIPFRTSYSEQTPIYERLIAVIFDHRKTY